MILLPCPPLAELATRAHSLQHQLRTLCPLPERMDAAVFTGPTSLPANLLRLVYVLPASQVDSDGSLAGLALHSLHVAVAALTRYRAQRPAPDGQAHAPWQRTQVALLCAAVLHDLGKLWTLEVSIDGSRWPPHRYLADVVHEQRASRIQVRYRSGHVRHGTDGYGALSLVYLTRIVPTGVLSWLGCRAVNELLSCIGDPSRTNTSSALGSLLADADRSVTAMEADRTTLPSDSRPQRDALPAQRLPSPSITLTGGHASGTGMTSYRPGSGSLADEVIHAFHQLMRSSQVRCNQPDGHLLISPTHTVIFLTMLHPDEPHLFRLILDQLRRASQASGVTGCLQQVYHQDDPGLLLDELAMSCTDRGRSWCVADPRCTGDSPSARSIRHCIRVEDVARTNDRWAWSIIVRNEAMWGSLDPAEWGWFTGRIVLRSDPTGPASADPEDLGFQVAEDHPSRPLISLRSPEDLEPGDALGDLPTLVRELMREIDGVVPVSPGCEGGRGLITAQESGGGIPAAAVLSALEDCIERLAFWRAAHPFRHGCLDQSQIAVPPNPTITTPAPVAARSGVDDRLVQRGAGLITALVRLARLASPSAIPLPDTVHAILIDKRRLLLPWPRCLDGMLDASTQVELSTMSIQLCHQLCLAPPKAIRLVGFPYRPGFPYHRVLDVDASWQSPTPEMPLPMVPIVVRSQLAEDDRHDA